MAERNARRLVRLADDLLLVSRADAGRLALEREDVDLAALAGECVESARPRAEAGGLTLGLDAERLPRIAGDRSRLAQVLDNLVSNALKLTPAGGIVRLRLRADGPHALIEVSDTGTGIAPEEQKRLFERFYRTERSRAVAGTGLGLAVSRMIVEAHGGRMEVESAAGAGSTFRLRLPLTPAGASAPRPSPAPAAEAVAPGR